MKQILQNLGNGETELVEVPCPNVKNGHYLIQTTRSLISSGTERMLLDFGKANYIEKAKQQPDKVRMVLEKIKTDGLLPTIDAVRSRLNESIPMGYCNVGRVIELDSQTGSRFNAGDRVVSNGPHAENVSVAKNLIAKIPDGVSDEEAAFTIIGSIALQGIRLAQPTLGETFIVTGLGLVGQIAVQLLLANGCNVIGIDFDSKRCELAETFGAVTVDLSQGADPLEYANSYTHETGVDGVLITADTRSSDPVHQAAQMCRKRGRIVLVGVTGLELNRADFYEKELSFQVSCSYGPGRYDLQYEEKGHDYPIGFVRWTEQRNFVAVLDLMAAGKLKVNSLITHRYLLKDVLGAYEMIAEGQEPYMGILIEYPVKTEKEASKPALTITLEENRVTQKESPVTAGILGAGNFTKQIFLPVLLKSGVGLKTIASSKGVSGTQLAKKFRIENSTTDANKVFADKGINCVFITTRHDTHYQYVMESIKSGKHIFVEKPLCLSLDQLQMIRKAWNDAELDENQLRLMVGFNRRFAPHIIKMKEFLDRVKEPKSIIITVNAGQIPADHWTQDHSIGGGRIIGEACHFIDLLRFLIGSPIQNSRIDKLESGVRDTVSINLQFKDGSIGAIHYFSNGNRGFPKERIEAFTAGRILQLNNFKTLRGFGWPGFKGMKLWKQDKGHGAGINAFIKSIKDQSDSPIAIDEIFEVMETTLKLANDSIPTQNT